MEKLIIIGAGNVGGYLSYNIDEFGSYDILGFLDDDPGKHGTTVYGRRVLGGIDQIGELTRAGDTKFVIGISSPEARQRMHYRLESFGIVFPNFVARTVWLSKSVKLGKGVILYPGVSINYETVVDDFVIMNMNCAVGHNCEIGRFSTMAPGVNLAGFTLVQEGVELGIGASTKQRVTLGRYARIGGQSMIVRDVLPNTTVVGVPGELLNK